MHGSLTLITASCLALLHAVSAVPAPAVTGTAANTALLPGQTVQPAPEYPNAPLHFNGTVTPEPIRGDGAGALILGKALQS